MTIHRWVQNPTLGFPRPLQIAGQNYWVRGDLVAFRDQQREKTEKARAPGTQPDGPPVQAASDGGGSMMAPRRRTSRGNAGATMLAVSGPPGVPQARPALSAPSRASEPASRPGDAAITGRPMAPEKLDGSGPRADGHGKADASLVERPTSRGRSSSATGTTAAPGLNAFRDAKRQPTAECAGRAPTETEEFAP